MIDDVIYIGRTIRAAIDVLYSWGRPQRVMLLLLVNKGHKELPFHYNFCGKKVATILNKTISSGLNHFDNEECFFLELLLFQKIFPKLYSPINLS